MRAGNGVGRNLWGAEGMLGLHGSLNLYLSAETDQKKRLFPGCALVWFDRLDKRTWMKINPAERTGSYPDSVTGLGLAGCTEVDVSAFSFSSLTDVLISPGVWNLRNWSNLFIWNEIPSMGCSWAALGAKQNGQEKVAKEGTLFYRALSW